MRPIHLLLLPVLTLILPARAGLPEFSEIYELVGTNLPTLTPSELNTLAVEGLLEKLGNRARLLDDATEPSFTGELIVGTRIFPGDFGYVRLGEVSGGVAPRLAAAIGKLAETDALHGLVLDLRFTGGHDFATAARVADLFFTPGEPVLDWGEGPYTATAKTNRFTQPVAVLVNAETRGSAEAVAAALHGAGLALVIGSRTAGEAAQYRDFALSDGRKLRLAVTPVKTGDGQPISADGLAPDIALAVPSAAERQYLEDPWALATSIVASTATTDELVAATRVRRRVNEAELIRAKQESLGQGESGASGTSAAATSTAGGTTVRDPALARGLDFLRGLNAVRGK